MTPDLRVISIGTLAAHPLWNEKGQLRTAHCTTTLISSGGAHILVNPSLPPQAMLARMSERTPIKPREITHVFLTSASSDHRRALNAFDEADWFMHESEREAALEGYKNTLDEAALAGDSELVNMLQQEIAAVEACRSAPDKIAPKIDLFPLPGVTAGTCGLLISLPASTILVCGDAIPTVEHLTQGKVLQDAVSIEMAQESFKEAIEIADVFVLGRDNIVTNPLRRM